MVDAVGMAPTVLVVEMVELAAELALLVGLAKELAAEAVTRGLLAGPAAQARSGTPRTVLAAVAVVA